MKNQYFGDVNDFRKYGLLRILTEQIDSQNSYKQKNKLSLAVCWMLTPDDTNFQGNSIHGNMTNYLRIPMPNDYSRLDSDLYNYFRRLDIINGKNRDVNNACNENCLPINSIFYLECVPSGKDARTEYFIKFLKRCNESEIIFFDPDNGINVKSRRYGTINSPKFLYWCELCVSFWSGHSIILYQHFGRQIGGRDKFIKDMADSLKKSIGVKEVHSFKSPHMVFFLLPHDKHIEILRGKINSIKENWSSDETKKAGFHEIIKH